MKNKYQVINRTNPEKATARVGINSFMMGSVFFILTLILSTGINATFPIVFQLVMAVPLLFVSSLAYSKLSYWKENLAWDRLGWITNHFGSWFLINVVGLLGASYSKLIGISYFTLTIFLMTTYATIKIKSNPYSWYSNVIKWSLVILTIIFGGIIYIR